MRNRIAIFFVLVVLCFTNISLAGWLLGQGDSLGMPPTATSSFVLEAMDNVMDLNGEAVSGVTLAVDVQTSATSRPADVWSNAAGSGFLNLALASALAPGEMLTIEFQQSRPSQGQPIRFSLSESIADSFPSDSQFMFSAFEDINGTPVALNDGDDLSRFFDLTHGPITTIGDAWQFAPAASAGVRDGIVFGDSQTPFLTQAYQVKVTAGSTGIPADTVFSFSINGRIVPEPSGFASIVVATLLLGFFGIHQRS